MREASRPDRSSRLGPSLLIAALWPRPGSSQDRSPQDLKGWGEAVDPGRDCRFVPDGDRLTIEVPATRHDLSAEAGDMSAPRVLSEVAGDFIVQVKVSGNVAHDGDRTSKVYLAYHGAGLLLWQNERNYIRLERAAVKRDDGVLHYANFELRKDGRHADSCAVEIPDQEHYVRVERRGGRVLGAISPDGVHWHYLEPIPVDFPRRIKVGVVAVNISTERFKAGFDELEIYRKEPDRRP